MTLPIFSVQEWTKLEKNEINWRHLTFAAANDAT